MPADAGAIVKEQPKAKAPLAVLSLVPVLFLLLFLYLPENVFVYLLRDWEPPEDYDADYEKQRGYRPEQAFEAE